jgi:hypothetical protein
MKIISLILFFIAVSCKSNNTVSINAITNKIPASSLNKEINLLMQSLESQTEQTKTYNPAYVSLEYPNGDVPISTGVCADVVVRAMRANHIDLQKEVHLDMSQHFSVYPNRWNLKTTDKNIDHRRVANLMKFFERKQKSISITKNENDYIPGDIVAWKLNNGLLHIGMVYNGTNEDRMPLIVHNIGNGTTIADVLFQWEIIGHYRWFE